MLSCLIVPFTTLSSSSKVPLKFLLTDLNIQFLFYFTSENMIFLLNKLATKMVTFIIQCTREMLLQCLPPNRYAYMFKKFPKKNEYF